MLSKKNLFKALPFFIQDCLISIYNTQQYIIRHSGKYRYYRNYYKTLETSKSHDLLQLQKKTLEQFLKHATEKSSWYMSYKDKQLQEFPILLKQDIIDNLNKISTINEKEGIISLTGGTTGASMKVIYTKKDIQERFAILDNFRAEHGYELGKKTAWFSGKNLISERDIQKNLCSHYDFINKIRFYSTFLINERNFDVYWNSLTEFKPEFIVGFPSSVYELCKIAEDRGLVLESKVKVFFPTAETVLSEHRNVIGRVLGCKLVDQYASSEGAPFILECKSGNLHIHSLTGIFEVIDNNFQPSIEGELLVTSFTTKGTPLIRYRIGDNIKLSSKDKICPCGLSFPLVDKIQGRSTDYLISPTHGKVNLGNLSNSTKDVKGIIRFQAIQNTVNEIKVLIVANDKFNTDEQVKFKAALAERFGPKVILILEIVDSIPNEKSGKFRIVKNNINHS